MEKMYIKSRLDCPPPESRQLLKDKDSLIQKQQEKIKDLETFTARLRYERDILHATLNQLIQNICNTNSLKSQISPSTKIPLVVESTSGLSTTPPSSSSSSSNSTSSLQLANTHASSELLVKTDVIAQSTDLSTDLAESLRAIQIIASAQDNLIQSNRSQFLNDEYLHFINSQLNTKLASNIDSCRSSLSSNSIKLDTFHSLSSSSNLVINPTSLSSLSLSTTPISSASSSLSSLKQKEDQEQHQLQQQAKQKAQDTEEESSHLNRLIEVRSFKNSVNSISSSMILSPNIKRTINKNTVNTGSNFRFKDCSNGSDGMSKLCSQNHRDQHHHSSIDYELSCDLKNKEIELLYRKYGGYLRCKRAARIIQLAYREYRLRKNYFKLCESNMKRNFDMHSGSPSLSKGAFDNAKPKQSSVVMRKQQDKKPDDETKFKFDMPRVDFDNLVMQFSNIANQPEQNKKESITSDDFKDYKNFDEFNNSHHHQRPAPNSNDDSYIAEDTDNEDELNNYEQEPKLLFAGNSINEKPKSASTSSIHLVGLTMQNTTTITAPTLVLSAEVEAMTNNTVLRGQARARDYESIQSKPIPANLLISNLNPPVSNRSLVKNKNMEVINGSYSHCQKMNKSLVINTQTCDSPSELLVNKNIHRNYLIGQTTSGNRPLTKSPCSVNSLFSVGNKQSSLLLTKDGSPKKQSSKIQKMLGTQSNFVAKSQQHVHRTNELLLMNSNVNTVKPAFDMSKRKYLVGLNMFNRKPEKGINYLIEEKFLEKSPKSIAEFLFNRNCLSKQMIGEYISNTQDKFILQILTSLIQLIDLQGLPVDEALRKFQTHFRMPGESQKIEHLINAFSLRYVECNYHECQSFFNCADETINVLAYAIILLNTSIHNPNVKASERMKFEQFLKMTKGIDNGVDIDKDYMQGIYDRVKGNEFKPGKDHTNSVNDFEKNLVGPKKPATLFSLPHRRLVCLVQLYEIFDLTKKEKSNSHQRECFLFNDILVVTKVFSKKKSQTLYTYRCGFPLQGMNVVLFVTNHYQYGIRLIRMPEKKVLITFNARNENDQQLFCRDLAESIAEANEMEHLRIKIEMEKFKAASGGGSNTVNKFNSSQIEVANFAETSSVSSSTSSSRSKSKCGSELRNTGTKAGHKKPSSGLTSMAPPATPSIKQPVSSFNRLHKRTLSNSLLDLNSSGGNLNPLGTSGTVKLNGLQRTGSECSLVANNSTNISLSHLHSLSSSKETPQAISIYSTPTKTTTNRLLISKEIIRLESSTENLLIDQVQTHLPPVKINLQLSKMSSSREISKLSSPRKLTTVQSRLIETETFSKKLSMSAQITCQNSQRQAQRFRIPLKNVESTRFDETTTINKIEAISLEEKLRKKKIFANDDYEYINYFGTPNVKNLKVGENEALLNNDETHEQSDIESLSPTSLSSQNSRQASTKYFTISSSAGHRFRKIIKKYV